MPNMRPYQTCDDEDCTECQTIRNCDSATCGSCESIAENHDPPLQRIGDTMPTRRTPRPITINIPRLTPPAPHCGYLTAATGILCTALPLDDYQWCRAHCLDFINDGIHRESEIPRRNSPGIATFAPNTTPRPAPKPEQRFIFIYEWLAVATDRDGYTAADKRFASDEIGAFLAWTPPADIQGHKLRRYLTAVKYDKRNNNANVGSVSAEISSAGALPATFTGSRDIVPKRLAAHLRKAWPTPPPTPAPAKRKRATKKTVAKKKATKKAEAPTGAAATRATIVANAFYREMDSTIPLGDYEFVIPARANLPSYSNVLDSTAWEEVVAPTIPEPEDFPF